jgi:hypothetical protein
MMDALRDRKTILLFFKEAESDKFVKFDRYLKRVLRPLYQRLHRRQKTSGFAVSFDLMRRALVEAGYRVRVNDYRTARANPDYPVGVVGFPVLLDGWTLRNPAVLGPSLYDHPMQAPRLFDNPSFRKYTLLASWMTDLYAPVFGEDRCYCWFAGLKLDQWPDLSQHDKEFDFLVYDKIRWDYDNYRERLLEPVLRRLEEKGLSYHVVRYRMYDHETYKSLLSRSRALLFLCEHETQGLAYQEAMSSGLPVLAWDRGYWADPVWNMFEQAPPPPASSVPFFSPECGETFRGVDDFDRTLDAFISKRSTYSPRSYVARALDPALSAKIYADQYFSLLDA